MLVTDGVPTLSQGCQGPDSFSAPVDPSPIIDAIAAAEQSGILTVVIGAPGSSSVTSNLDARHWLSKAARAGGTARCNCSDDGPSFCHVDMSQSTDLAAGIGYALRQVSCGLVNCQSMLPPPPVGGALDPCKVNIAYHTSTETGLIRRNDASDCQYGWHLSDDDKMLEICPGTCAALQCEPYSSLLMFFGCATGPIIL